MPRIILDEDSDENENPKSVAETVSTKLISLVER